MPLNNKSTTSKKQNLTEKVEFSALTSLLKSLDNRLSNLDNNSNSHIKFISDTFKWTENVIDYCKNIEKQISNKEEKKKINEKNDKIIISEKLNKTSKIKTRNKRNTIGFSRTNTELRLKINPIQNNYFFSIKSLIPPKKKTLKSTKSTTNLNEFKSVLISNVSLNKNNNNNNNNSNKLPNKVNDLNSNKIVKNKIIHRKSLVLTQRPTLKSSKTTKNLKIERKSLVSSVVIKNKKKHLPRINTESNLNKSGTSKGENNKTLDNSFSRIISMEDTFQYDMNFNCDPLLTDLDFNTKGLLINDNIGKINPYVKKTIVEEFIENDTFSYIIKYLTNQDTVNLMNANKLFRKNCLKQIISNLKEEKNKYKELISCLDENNVGEKYNIDQMIISNKTEKAIQLLNDNSLNKLFFQKEPPSKDILLIYYLYFQMIKHPIINLKSNKKEFWKKCCEYFIKEEKGKIGILLEKNFKKLILTPDNIYKILKLLDGNLIQINLNNFSKIYRTTGLFTFYIKDILNFLGITNEKTLSNHSYWTFKDVIEFIKTKIEILKKYETRV